MNIEPILTELNLKFKVRGERAVMLCPFHTEKTPSFTIEINDPHRYKCWGCKAKGNIFTLYNKLTGKRLGKPDEPKEQEFFAVPKPVVTRPTIERCIYFTEGKKYAPSASREVLEYLKNRGAEGVSKEFCDYFDITFTVQMEINRDDKKGTFFTNRLLIPVYENQKLVTIEGRSYTGAKPKVLYPRNSKVDTLFNIDNLDRTKPLLIAEGIFKLPPLFDLGYRNIASTFGSELTANKLKLLNEFSEVWVFPDNDVAGESYLSALDEGLTKDFFICQLPSHVKDLDECTKKEIVEVINQRVTYTDYLFNKHKKEKEIVAW